MDNQKEKCYNNSKQKKQDNLSGKEKKSRKEQAVAERRQKWIWRVDVFGGVTQNSDGNIIKIQVNKPERGEIL